MQLPVGGFCVYNNGQILDEAEDQRTLQELGVGHQTIIDVVGVGQAREGFRVGVEYGSDWMEL